MTAHVAREAVVVTAALVAVGALANHIAHLPAAVRPQRTIGGDVLSVAFGDARRAISQAMERRADVYFHGGINPDDVCRHSRATGAGTAHRADSERDPWSWINRRIRAPEVDRHLKQDRVVELMPWFWAAVRMNPQNVPAWTEAAYVAGHLMRKPDLQMEILARAREANPGSVVLALGQARATYPMGKGDVAAAEQVFEEARRLARKAQAANALAGADARAFADVLAYLSLLAEKRGDVRCLQRCRDEIDALQAEDIDYVRRSIANRLRNCPAQGNVKQGVCPLKGKEGASAPRARRTRNE